MCGGLRAVRRDGGAKFGQRHLWILDVQKWLSSEDPLVLK
jgi:hypothetical protein